MSFRRVWPFHWLANLMAMEALATSAFNADVFELVPASGATGRALADRGRLRRAAAAVGVPAFRLQPEPPSRPQYDLLLVLANDFVQLYALEGLSRFPRLARVQVLLQTEIWEAELSGPIFPRLQKSVLNRFEVIFSALESSLNALRASLSADVRRLPLSVDTEAFSNRPGPRPVAVTSLGRRDPEQHRALTAWADAAERWYYYDATPPGLVHSFPEHLSQLGALLQRSSIWVANRARFDDTAKHQGHAEIGLRFYEGLAAGCAILGDFPDTPEFQRTFADLPGMIAMPCGSQRVPDEVDRLLHDASHAARIAAVHQARALRTCDIAHRLRSIAQAAELPVPDLLERRIAALAARAAALDA